MAATIGQPDERLVRRRRWGAVLLGLAAAVTAVVPSLGGATTAGAAPVAASEAALTWKLSEHAWSSSSLSPSHATEAPAAKAEDGFRFTGGGGTFDHATGAASIHFAGSFTLGNVVQGGYRIRLGALHLVLAGDGTGEVRADVAHCASAVACTTSGFTTVPGVVVAELSGVSLTSAGAQRTATVTPDVELVPGQPAGGLVQFPQSFLDALPAGLQGHFRQTGSASDANKVPAPVSFSFTVAEPATTTTSSTSTSSTVAPTSSTTSVAPTSSTSTSTSTTSTSTTSTSTTSTSTTSSTIAPTSTSTTSVAPSSSTTSSTSSTSTTSSTSSTVAPTSSTTSTVPDDGQVRGGTLDWGVKASFRAYVTGPIAHGSVTPGDPATANPDGTFRFPLAAGTYAAPDDLAARYTGSVAFTGHEGALALTLSEPRVVVDGEEGTLVVDAQSTRLGSSAPDTYDDVAFATLDLSTVTPQVSGHEVVLADVPAVLTEEGAPAFAGFYEAGAPLDPLTLVLSLDEEDGTPPPPPSSTTSTTAVAAAGCFDRSTVAAGTAVSVCGDGFLGGEQVQVVLHSTPTTIAAVTASADGTVTATVTIPSGTGAGSHRLELRGITSGRSVFTAPFTVTAAPPGTSDRGLLPRTGDELYDVARVALVLLGLGLLFTGRSLAR